MNLFYNVYKHQDGKFRLSIQIDSNVEPTICQSYIDTFVSNKFPRYSYCPEESDMLNRTYIYE